MIWVIGNAGMLGTEVTALLEKEFDEVVATDREVSILELDALKEFTKDKDINWIVNCSAYTAVDKAEEDVDFCYALNETGVANIATIANEIGSKLIHVSTDYVFDGTSSIPLIEEAPTAPIGVYGASKLAGENRIRETLKQHFIIRTAWLYGEHGNNFVHTMLRLMAEKDQLGVIADQVGSPTWAFDLASLIIEIIKQVSSAYGTYHYSNEGDVSWHGFAEAILELGIEKGILSNSIPINPLTTDQYPTPAKRPAYSLLNKTKIKETFGVEVPHWKDSLNKFLTGKTDA